MANAPAITIAPAAPRSIAGIGVFRDRERCLAALRAEFGVPIPTTPRSVQAGAVTLSCLAPARYLASAGAGANLPARLADALDGLAAITDHSDQWAIFALCGPLTCEVLARLLPIDITPSVFGIGDVALTRAGHMDLRLWRLDDLGYELAVTRSCAEYLYAVLDVLSRGPIRQ